MDTNRKRLGTVASLGFAAWIAGAVQAQESPRAPVITLQAPSSQASEQAIRPQGQMTGPSSSAIYPSGQGGAAGFGAAAGLPSASSAIRSSGKDRSRSGGCWSGAPRPSSQYAPAPGMPAAPGAAAPLRVRAGWCPVAGRRRQRRRPPVPRSRRWRARRTQLRHAFPGRGCRGVCLGHGNRRTRLRRWCRAAASSFPMIGDRGPLFLRQNLRFPPVPSPLPPGVPRPGNNPVLGDRAIGCRHRARRPRIQDRRQPVPQAGRPRLGQLQLLQRRQCRD